MILNGFYKPKLWQKFQFSYTVKVFKVWRDNLFVYLTVHTAKTRSIPLPVELEAHVNMMLSHSNALTLSRSSQSIKNLSRLTRAAVPTNPWDYKNIIEKLQVCVCVCVCLKKKHHAHSNYFRFWRHVTSKINNLYLSQIKLPGRCLYKKNTVAILHYALALSTFKKFAWHPWIVKHSTQFMLEQFVWVLFLSIIVYECMY